VSFLVKINAINLAIGLELTMPKQQKILPSVSALFRFIRKTKFTWYEEGTP